MELLVSIQLGHINVSVISLLMDHDVSWTLMNVPSTAACVTTVVCVLIHNILDTNACVNQDFMVMYMFCLWSPTCIICSCFCSLRFLWYFADSLYYFLLSHKFIRVIIMFFICLIIICCCKQLSDRYNWISSKIKLHANISQRFGVYPNSIIKKW